jgi:hypothetical protein
MTLALMADAPSFMARRWLPVTLLSLAVTIADRTALDTSMP